MPGRERKTLTGITHGREGYRKGCGCDVCRTAEISYQNKRRRQRGRSPANVIPMKRAGETNGSPKRRNTIGPMERAVVSECEGLERAEERPTLVAAACNLAKIVDNPELKGLHTSTVKQIMSILTDLHGEDKKAAGSRRKSGGRLATVRRMTKSKRA